MGEGGRAIGKHLTDFATLMCFTVGATLKSGETKSSTAVGDNPPLQSLGGAKN
jgi:hypothetical protein